MSCRLESSTYSELKNCLLVFMVVCLLLLQNMAIHYSLLNLTLSSYLIFSLHFSLKCVMNYMQKTELHPNGKISNMHIICVSRGAPKYKPNIFIVETPAECDFIFPL